MKTFKLTMILFCLITSTFLTKEIIELKLYNFDFIASLTFVLMPLILALILIINLNK